MKKLSFRECLRSVVYGSWRRQGPIKDGYSIILACPMDMPFLLELALRTIDSVDTTRCEEILIVPDGAMNDGGQLLKSVLAKRNDSRLRYITPPIYWRWVMPYVHNHPAMMAIACEHAKCRYAFVHDLDAFLLESSTIESLFDEATERQMYAMGVTERWDSGFQKLGMSIPGTWELFFDTVWLKKWPRQMVFGRCERTEIGAIEFDSMLYPQYLDYCSGRIGVTRNEYRIVHFNGTVRSFRVFQQKKMTNQPVHDSLFRILLLSILETMTNHDGEHRLTPTIEFLSECLDRSRSEIVYNQEVNMRGYAEFRTMVDEMLQAPIFNRDNEAQIRSKIASFDAHFGFSASSVARPAITNELGRRSGID